MPDSDLPGDLIESFKPGYVPDFAFMAATVLKHQPARRYKAGPHIRAKLIELEPGFDGQSYLAFYHAGIIVHLRREKNTEENVERFFGMWREQGDFLLEALNLRWLISACDTIIDVSPENAERAMALCAVTFLNTVKLYETERLVTSPDSEYSRLVVEAPPLFDGVTAYSMGNGDMIVNMFERVSKVAAEGTLAGRILVETVRRVKNNETVFRRLQAVHWKDKSKW